MKKMLIFAITFIFALLFANASLAAFNPEFPNAQLTVTLGETELLAGNTYEVKPGDIIHIKAESLCDKDFAVSWLYVEFGYVETKNAKIATSRGYYQGANSSCFSEKMVEWDFIVPNSAVGTERSVYVTAELESEEESDEIQVRLYDIKLKWVEEEELNNGVTFFCNDEIVAENEEATIEEDGKIKIELNRPIEAYGFNVFVNGKRVRKFFEYNSGKIGFEANLKEGKNEIRVEVNYTIKPMQSLPLTSQTYYIMK